MSEFLSIAQAADALGVSVPTATRLIRDGYLTASASGGPRNVALVQRADVVALMADRHRDAISRHPDQVAYAREIAQRLWPLDEFYVLRADGLGLERQERRGTSPAHAAAQLPLLPTDAGALFGRASVEAAAQPLTADTCRWCLADAFAIRAGSFGPVDTDAYAELFGARPCAADRQRWVARAALRATQRDAVATRADARLRTDALRLAELKVGAAYKLNASGPVAFDCSGLISWAFTQAADVAVPRTYSALLERGTRVPLTELEPGDLVLARRQDGPGHVAFVAGGGRVLQALPSGVGYAPLTAEDWSTGLRIASGPITAAGGNSTTDAVRCREGAAQARAQGDEDLARQFEALALAMDLHNDRSSR